MMPKCMWCDLAVHDEEVPVDVMGLHFHSWCIKDFVIEAIRTLRSEIATAKKGNRS
jgi:hypothetical protein